MRNLSWSFSLSVLIFLAASASAQYRDAGKLNTWSFDEVQRKHETAGFTYIKDIRIAKQKGFDRVVFEFTNDIPNYNARYVDEFATEGSESIKLNSRYYFEVDFYSIPYADEAIEYAKKYPSGKQSFSQLRELEMYEHFEGVMSFALGLQKKNKFRVTELDNPARLVIDFQH